MSLLEQTFLYQALGKTNFFLVVVGLPVGFLAYQIYQNKQSEGDTNNYPFPKSGTMVDKASNLTAKATKNNGGYASYYYNKFYNGEQMAANFH